MTVVGYPLGGETISVSKGVVSRIEVCSTIYDETYDMAFIKAFCLWNLPELFGNVL